MAVKQYEQHLIERQRKQQGVNKMLFVGLPQRRGVISYADNINTLTDILSDNVDNYTFMPVAGMFESTEERSVVIYLFDVSQAQINRIVTELKEALSQECIGCTDINPLELL